MPRHKPQPQPLPADVPVEMPDLPKSLTVNTPQQMKAAGDPLRTRILFIIQHQPMTAKQIAQRLGATPGAMGHHLKVLEEAGLAQIVAKRITRGIIAKYYTRTARIFNFQSPTGLSDKHIAQPDIFGDAYDEWKEVRAEDRPHEIGYIGFPHARLSPKRAKVYAARVQKLVDDLLSESPDPSGTIYGLSVAFFASPAYIQVDKQALAKGVKKSGH